MQIETLLHIQEKNVTKMTDEEKMDFIISALRYLAREIANLQRDIKRK